MPDTKIQCYTCGEHPPDNEIIEHNEVSFCEDCYNEQYCSCDDCSDIIEYDDATLVNNEEYICDICIDNNYIKCSCCDEYTHNNNTIYVNDYGSVCNSCYENGDFGWCETCEENFHHDDMNYRDEGAFCNDCEENSQGTIHNYHYKPIPNFHHLKNGFPTIEQKTLKKDTLYMGIELEIDSSERNESKEECAEQIARDESTFYCKNDGSLDYGFEIVSHPISWQYFKQNKITFENVLKTSKQYGFL